jgi:hypothetical protein
LDAGDILDSPNQTLCYAVFGWGEKGDDGKGEREKRFHCLVEVQREKKENGKGNDIEKKITKLPFTSPSFHFYIIRAY